MTDKFCKIQTFCEVVYLVFALWDILQNFGQGNKNWGVKKGSLNYVIMENIVKMVCI